MEREIKQARKLVKQIIKNLGRKDLEWTVQVSMNSIHTNKLSYCTQIEAPANGLQPLTWICGSWEELLKKLQASAEGLNQDEVEKAYYRAEMERAEAKRKFFEDKVKELEQES